MKQFAQIRETMRRTDRNGYLFSLPYILFVAAFVAYPLIFSFVLIFNRWNIVTPMQWVGMKNFERMASDPLFYKAIGNTLIFLCIHIPLQIVVALGFALLLNSRIRARGLFRAIFFLPVVVSGVVVTILWQQMYSYDEGLLNNLFAVFGWGKVPWLIDARFAMPSIALMATWKNVGIYIILFLVGLQGIPSELYEAADLDGADARRKFFRITLPMLNPTVVVVIVLSTIGGFSLFIEPYVLTGGGPMQSTLSAFLYIYNQAFYFDHMGYAAALAFAFAFFILLVVVLQRKLVETESVS